MRKSKTTKIPVSPQTWDDLFIGPQDPGLTAVELNAKYKVPLSTIRLRLQKMVDAGQCVRGQAERFDCTGRRYIATVYQLIGEM